MKPNEKVAAACRQALDWHQEHTDRRGFCEQWMVTFARTVTSNKRPATIMRVNDWFDNHEQFRTSDGFFASSDPTPERMAWEMLGGDEGRAWAAAYARNHHDQDDGTGGASAADQLVELDDQAETREHPFGSTDNMPPPENVIYVTGAAAQTPDPNTSGRIVSRLVAYRGGTWVPSFQHRPTDPDLWASAATFAEFEGRRPEWAGVLTLEGVETSDRRLIQNGALSWRDLPLTLQDQLLSQPGHDGAAAAGPITNIYREGNEIRGEGFFDSGDEGQAARRRMAEGTKQGVSVDLTEVELDLPDDPDDLLDILLGDGLLVILAARIAAATLVSIPAFEGARLQIVGDISDVEPPALVASGGKLPPDVTLKVVVPVETLTAGFVASANTADDISDVEQVQWYPISELAPGQYPIEQPTSPIDLHLYHIQDEGSVWVEQSTANSNGPLPGLGRWAHAQRVSPPGNTPEGGVVVASAGTGGPPRAWFEADDYVGPTPFKIGDPTPDGYRQIDGHIAVWGSCHIGFSGRCVDVPRGLDYDSFQGPQVPGEVLCGDGSTVKAGPIVMDTVHPSLKAKASDAAAHYADTGSLVAQGCLYEDEFGLQVRGWIMPSTTATQIADLRAADLSPDWRPRATARGGRGVVALLAVPVSGFNLGLVASAGNETGDETGVPVDEMAIVGTNWTPALTAVAARKKAVLESFDLPVPDGIARLAAAVEPPAVTARKEAVLARLAGASLPCDCGC